jgi:hypothetical protein
VNEECETCGTRDDVPRRPLDKELPRFFFLPFFFLPFLLDFVLPRDDRDVDRDVDLRPRLWLRLRPRLWLWLRLWLRLRDEPADDEREDAARPC